MLYAYFIVIIVTAYDWVKLRVALRRLLGVQLTLCPPRRAAYTLPPPCVIVASDNAVDPAVAYLSSASANTIAIATSERWRGSAACRRRLAHILAIQDAPRRPPGGTERWGRGQSGAQQRSDPPASAQLQKHTNRYTNRQRVGEGRGCIGAACCIAAGNSPGNGMGNTCLIYIFIAVLILRHWAKWKVVK